MLMFILIYGLCYSDVDCYKLIDCSKIIGRESFYEYFVFE